MPAATVSTAGILPDCPETVLPTVSTHGRGRLGVPRQSFRSVTLNEVSKSQVGPTPEGPMSQQKILAIFSAID